MEKTKKFKLHFYKIDIDDSLFEITSNKIDALSLKLKSVIKPKNVYSINGYQSFVRHIKDEIYCFEKHRTDDLPSVGSVTDNKERNLNLKDGETLIEKNYFLIDSTLGYIIYQEKQEGFRATSLSIYFQKLLEEKTRKIHIHQILQSDAYNRLMKYGYLKSMEVTFASPSDKQLKEFGVSLNNRILYKKNKRLNISIKVSLEKKETVAQTFISKVRDKFIDNSDNIKTLRLKGSKHEDDTLEDINLAKDVIEAIADVRIEENQIVQEDMIKDLEKAYLVHHSEIKDLIEDE